MPKKVQITYLVEQSNADYVQALADHLFEGNASMAIRKIIADHSRKINRKVEGE